MKPRLRHWAERWKPAAAAQAHLFSAALLWSVVGAGLLVAGLHWCAGSRFPGWLLLAGAGLVIGLAKGRLLLRRVAERNAARIVARGDGHCLGGFLSWRTWLLVALMMASGALLRRSPVPRPLLGLVYTAVGTALLSGCVVLWTAFARGQRDSLR